jgi:hypothetical protein
MFRLQEISTGSSLRRYVFRNCFENLLPLMFFNSPTGSPVLRTLSDEQDDAARAPVARARVVRIWTIFAIISMQSLKQSTQSSNISSMSARFETNVPKSVPSGATPLCTHHPISLPPALPSSLGNLRVLQGRTKVVPGSVECKMDRGLALISTR